MYWGSTALITSIYLHLLCRSSHLSMKAQELQGGAAREIQRALPPEQLDHLYPKLFITENRCSVTLREHSACWQ